MFERLKKKPIEQKHGHENYLQDYAHYEPNDRNWILLLSALFVEAKDLDMWEHRARHDLLDIYPKGVLDQDEQEELGEDFVLETVDDIQERYNNVYDLQPWNIEDDLYYAINSKSAKEAVDKAADQHDDDQEKKKLYKDIYKHRDKYKHTHMRMGIIAHSMWQIRMAVYFGVVTEEVAWDYLEKFVELARPLMALYDSWEAYHENIKQFHEIYEFDYPEERKYYKRASASLLRREESPLHLIPIDFGVDASYQYNIISHSNYLPKRIPSGDTAREIMLEALMEREDKTKLFEVLDGLEGTEYDEAFQFVVRKSDRKVVDEEDLIELPERYGNLYAYAMRAGYFYNFAWEARGEDTADKVGEENFELFYERLGWALNDLFAAYELDPMEKNIWSRLYSILSHFHSDEAVEKKEEIYQLIRKHALDHPACVFNVEQFKQKRWGGSFEESRDWAREIMAGTSIGDPIRRIIYWVMIEHADYYIAFDEDEEKANAVFQDKNNQTEVNQYFDELLAIVKDGPYSLFDYMVYWYAKVGDYHRLRQLVHTRPVGKFDLDAMNGDYTEEYTDIIMNWFRSI